jgi:plasmid stabilization system protein ParE
VVKSSLPTVNWNKRASQRLKNIYHEILQDSYSNAEKVRSGIVEIVDQLPSHPEKYPPDKYKKANQGDYRAFEKYSYRKAYKHTDKEIRILRIRYVHPLNHCSRAFKKTSSSGRTKSLPSMSITGNAM